MNGRSFVDSNVLIYAYDVDAKRKHTVANQLLVELWQTRTGVLSLQVLQEFYVNVTRKIPAPLSKSAARMAISRYVPWCVAVTAGEVLYASEIEERFRISFWDALIVAAALKCGADRIITEDLSQGQMIAGIRIENPFR